MSSEPPTLTTEELKALYFHYKLQGLNQAEIAKVLELPRQTFQSHLKKATTKLDAAYGEEIAKVEIPAAAEPKKNKRKSKAGSEEGPKAKKEKVTPEAKTEDVSVKEANADVKEADDEVKDE